MEITVIGAKEVVASQVLDSHCECVPKGGRASTAFQLG